MFQPPGFDRALAIEAANLVIQAYAQFKQFTQHQPWKLQGAYDNLGEFEAKPEGLIAHLEPFGFVARSQASGNVFVTFRGTETLGDWLSDFGFPQVPYPWGHVERGFFRLYDQCAAAVKAAVQKAPGARVIVTGHSLGAGMAVLAAADLAGLGAQMYSFAGPRVGDLEFAKKFNQSVPVAWRVVNTEDIVTTVPLATVQLMSQDFAGLKLALLLKTLANLNYQHVGQAVCFTTHTGSIEGNHSMVEYLAAL